MTAFLAVRPSKPPIPISPPSIRISGKNQLRTGFGKQFFNGTIDVIDDPICEPDGTPIPNDQPESLPGPNNIECEDLGDAPSESPSQT